MGVSARRRDLAVGGVRVPRLDGGRQDDVLAAPERLEAGRLGPLADLEGGSPVDADAAGERQPELHLVVPVARTECQSATDAGIQLPWNPCGMRGSSTDATGVASIVAASRTTKRLASVVGVVDERHEVAVVLGLAARRPGTNTGSPGMRPRPSAISVRSPVWRSYFRMAPAVLIGSSKPESSGMRHHVAVAVLQPDHAVGDAGELARAVVDLLLVHRAGRRVDRPPPELRAREVHHRVAPDVAEAGDVEHDRVAVLVGVHRVEHVAGVDVVPAHVGVGAVARHHAEPGRVVVVPVDGHLAAHRHLEVEHGRQVHEDDVVPRDVEVVHHRRARRR